jgi:hypothetical protein
MTVFVLGSNNSRRETIFISIIGYVYITDHDLMPVIVKDTKLLLNMQAITSLIMWEYYNFGFMYEDADDITYGTQIQ